MNRSLANILKYLVFLAIAFGLLYLAFKDNDPQKMLRDLKQANYTWVAIAVGCGYLAVMSRGLRWNILLDSLGYKPKTYSAIHAVNVGYLANLAVPRLGEITRCTAMNTAEKIPVDKLIGTVILERVVDMLMLGLLFLVALVLKYDALKDFIYQGLESKQSTAAGSSSPTLIWVALACVIGIGLAAYIFRNALLSLKWVGKIKTLLIGVYDGFKAVFQTPRKLEFILHTLFIWGMYFFMSYLYFLCLPATSHLTISDGIFIMIVGGMGMIAPAPGGLGAFHAAIILGLTTLKIDADSARSYAVISHSSQTLMMLFTGALALFLLSLGRKKAKNAVL